MNNPDYICAAFYFSSTRRDDWAQSSWEGSGNCAERLGLRLTDFFFETYDRHSCGGEKSFTPEDLDVLSDELSADHVMTWGVNGAAPHAPTELPSFTLIVNDQRAARGFGLIYLQLDLSFLPAGLSPQELVHPLLNEWHAIFDINYGCVHRMTATDLPANYFTACSLVAPTPELERDLIEWDAKSPYFQNTIRNLYWGNYLSDGHWSDSTSRDDLQNALQASGHTHCSVEGDNGLFFYADLDLVADNWESEFANYQSESMPILTTFGVKQMFDFEVDERTRIVEFRPPTITRSDNTEQWPSTDSGEQATDWADDDGQTMIPALSEPEAPDAVTRPKRSRLDTILDQCELYAELADGYAEDDERQIYPSVALEEFFEGNGDDSTVGGNMLGHPGVDAFYRILKAVRRRRDVADVQVQISLVDRLREYQDWPLSSELIYVITTATCADVEEWFHELEPDEVSQGFALGPPPNPPELPDGMTLFSLLWD